jgi:glucan-binding YG repeat protein
VTATEVAPAVAEAKSPQTETVLAAAAKAAAESPAPSVTAADYATVKFEGASEEFHKDYREVAAELGLKPKDAQALIDKLFPKLAERAKAQRAAAEEADKKAIADERKAWQDELAKDPEFAADKTEANSKAAQLAFQHAGKGVYERLKQDGLDEHPAVTRIVVNVGRRLLAATAVDSAAPHVAAPAKGEDIGDVSVAAFARSYFGEKGR